MMSRYRRNTNLLVIVVTLLFAAVPATAQQAATSKLTILLSNDDGYDAPGLQALIRAFQPVANIVVAAPASEQSLKSHSLASGSQPILATEKKQADGTIWWAIDAPPATCVRIALENLLPRRPDLVISGINRGENLGIDIYYSGTLAAAREAAIVGVAAIAVSVRGNKDEDYAATANYTRELVEQLDKAGLLRPGLFLNVNAPAGEWKGVRVARMSVRPGHENFERRSSPRGQPYFWSVWRPLEDDEEGTDVWAFARGYITLTPMVIDLTAGQKLDSWRQFERAGAARK